MKIERGDRVTLDYSDLDPKLKKGLGVPLQDKMEGIVDEIIICKDKKVRFTLAKSEVNGYRTELHSVERIVKLNGKKV